MTPPMHKEEILQRNYLRTLLKPYFVKQESHDGPGSLTWAKIRSGGHFVQRSATILISLVEGHPRNISAKLFWRAIGLGVDVI